MNKVILMGRLTRDPEMRYSKSDNPIAIARYTLAVDRRRTAEGQQAAEVDENGFMDITDGIEEELPFS